MEHGPALGCGVPNLNLTLTLPVIPALALTLTVNLSLASNLAHGFLGAVVSLTARLRRVLDSQYMVTEPQIAQPEELAPPALVVLQQVRLLALTTAAKGQITVLMPNEQYLVILLLIILSMLPICQFRAPMCEGNGSE